MPTNDPGVTDAINALSRSTRRVSMSISSDENADLTTAVEAIASNLRWSHADGPGGDPVTLPEAVIRAGRDIRDGLYALADAVREVQS